MGIEFSNFENAAGMQNANNGVFARFYDRVVKTGELKENGMPVFESKLYIEIKIRDERDVFDQPAGADHIRRFEKEYQRYKNEKKELEKGTPLNQFALLSLEQIESCRFHGIFTIEALAKLEWEKAKSLELEKEKQLAITFLNFAKDNRDISTFVKKEKMYIDKIKRLEEELKRIKANDNVKIS